MIISNSEGDTYLGCRRQHYYRYALGLYPKTLSRANHIGLLGHYVLEHYYRAIKDGASRDDAFHRALDALVEADGHEEDDIIALISKRFMQYHEYYAKDTFEIVGVESVHKVDMNDHITLGSTLDLLVKYVEGPWAGQFVVWDHKFKYNFLTADELSMHAQTFKYIWALRQQGYEIKHSVINQIRYRSDIKNVDKLFLRTELTPSDILVKNIMTEHLTVAEDIYDHKTKPVSWYASHAPRRLNGQMACGNCYFRVPCRQELLGVDVSRTFTTMYATSDPNTLYKPYGY